MCCYKIEYAANKMELFIQRRFHNKENSRSFNQGKKAVKCPLRRPFADRNSTLNIENTKYDRKKINDHWTTEYVTKESNTPTKPAISDLNPDWEVTNDKYIGCKNKIISTAAKATSYLKKKVKDVNLQRKSSLSVGNMEALSPFINMKHFSNDISSKYFKTCVVHMADVVNDGNFRQDIAIRSPDINVSRISSNKLNNSFKKCTVSLTNMFNDPEIKSKYLGSNTKVYLNMVSHVKTKQNIEVNSNRSLRKRKQINYAVLAQGPPLHDTNSGSDISQSKNQTSSKKGANNIYEFDSDSNKSKSDIEENMLDKSIPFETHMKLTMKEIQLNHKEAAKKGRKRLDSTKTRSKTQKTNAWEYFSTKNASKPKRPRRYRRRKSKPRLVPDKEVKLAVNNVGNMKYESEDELGTKDSDSYNSEVDNHENVEENEERDIDNASNVNIRQNIILNNEEILLTANSDKSSDKQNECVKEPSPNVTIDIFQELLDDDSWGDFANKDKMPDHNSTMITTKRKSSISSPWRVELGVKRNPHFLQYKETSLPNYNQDMIIDDRMTARILSGSKTPSNFSHSSSTMKQSSIKSFMTGKSRSNSPDIINSSLFDAHELSPLKSLRKLICKSSNNKENQIANESERDGRKGILKVKRQILTESINNSANITSNIRKSPRRSPRKSNGGIENNFGFESFSEHTLSDKKSPKKVEKSKVWLFGKPLRLEDYVQIVKTSKNKVVNENFSPQNTESVSEEPVITTNNTQLENGTTNEETMSPIGIFEDLIQINKKNVSKNYERKRRKRVRRVSTYHEEQQENHEDVPKKKKKDIRTKNEEEEAEKWAKNFNAMCEEVEDFALEIE